MNSSESIQLKTFKLDDILFFSALCSSVFSQFDTPSLKANRCVGVRIGALLKINRQKCIKNTKAENNYKGVNKFLLKLVLWFHPFVLEFAVDRVLI